MKSAKYIIFPLFLLKNALINSLSLTKKKSYFQVNTNGSNKDNNVNAILTYLNVSLKCGILEDI